MKAKEPIKILLTAIFFILLPNVGKEVPMAKRTSQKTKMCVSPTRQSEIWVDNCWANSSIRRECFSFTRNLAFLIEQIVKAEANSL